MLLVLALDQNKFRLTKIRPVLGFLSACEVYIGWQRVIRVVYIIWLVHHGDKLKFPIDLDLLASLFLVLFLHLSIFIFK